jgi:hypothetical protein
MFIIKFIFKFICQALRKSFLQTISLNNVYFTTFRCIGIYTDILINFKKYFTGFIITNYKQKHTNKY